MAPHPMFRDRQDAGRRLGSSLARYRGASPIVLGLPRGGVAVAYEVACALGAPLDVWVVRKLGAPIQPELGMGAVAEGGEVLLDETTVQLAGATKQEVDALVARKSAEVETLCRLYRGDRPGPELRGRTVILVDDGIATGGTARSALRAIWRREPKKVVIATPVAGEDIVASLENEADDVVCLAPVQNLFAIGFWYEDFSPVSDQQVIAWLDRARCRSAVDQPPEGARSLSIETPAAVLAGDLDMPQGARALVLLPHGSGGGGRSSPCNQLVARRLQRARFATLLLDLSTDRFDLLARRLVGATDWVQTQPELRGLRLGYFGARNAAAAALVAAAQRPNLVGAVVSRGGRPDLAERALPRVRAPTLFIVGGLDADVLQLNRESLELVSAPKKLEIVSGATHSFEEPGALDRVADLAVEWFARHLAAPTGVEAHP